MSNARNRPLLVRHGRLVDPASNFDGPADVLVLDGRVAAVAPSLPDTPGAIIIDASGCIVSPGFVDLHTHLRFPGFPDKETMESGTAAAAAGGFTTVCAMANTNPVVDRVEVLAHVLAEARRSARVRVLQLAAVSLGLQGKQLTDMPALAAAGAVAFSDDGKPVWQTEIMRDALQMSAALGQAVSVHEEDPAIVGQGVANAGPPARRLRLAEWPCSGEAGLVARDIALLEQVGGHLHVAHLSCADTVPLVRATRERGLTVTAEATPHHLRLTDRLLEGDEQLGLPPAHPCTKVNPPLRSEEDVDAVVQAVADGTIDAIATDHAPHTAADKAQPYSSAAFGFSAIETALPLVLDLVRVGRLNLPTVIERLTIGPARVFGLDVGTLRTGAAADICIFNPNTEWTMTRDALRSKGKNTPLLGARLTGRVMYTIVGGTIVYQASD